MPILHHDRVTASDQPRGWLYMVHGIFGQGRNWRSVARHLVKTRPEWGVLLVDLRQHGASQGFKPPHTIEAAAADLAALARTLGLPPVALLGHSFGGKVSLAFGRVANPELKQIWVIDSTPDAREPAGGAYEMLKILQALPGEFASRDDAIGALQERGVAEPTAHWMATNLEPAGEGFRWRFRIEDMAVLLDSFFEHDAWDVVEDPPQGVVVHLVKAEESSVLAGAALARAEAAAQKSARVHVHSIAGGHWVNADNPEAIIALLAAELPDPSLSGNGGGK